MEPQPITPPVAPAPQSPKNTRTIAITIGIIVIVIVVVICAAAVLLKHPATDDSQTSIQASDQNPKTALIQYVSTLSSAIKTIPEPGYEGAVKVFIIGSFAQGEFQGKNLSLAIFQYTNSNWNNGNNAYVYYISDATGNLVAWDPNFLHDGGTYADSIDDSAPPGFMKDFVGLSSNTQQSLGFLPPELSIAKDIKIVDGKTTLSVVDDIFLSSDMYSQLLSSEPTASSTPIASSESGWSIVKRVTNTNTILPHVSYFMLLPFGFARELSAEPDFVDANDVPQLIWSAGTSTVASYRYGQYAYGWEDCYDGVTLDELNASLIRTGSTERGIPVYELDAQKYPKVYQCLHEKTKRYVYNDTTKTGSYVDTVSYADFVLSHPMFFWKHPLGDLIAFVRSDVVPAAEKAKPVIYLYPEKTGNVRVTVSPQGGFAKTDPDYGNGWNVQATPDSTLTNIKDGKKYPYLFWEGGKDGVVNTPQQGFVVSKDDVAALLTEKLSDFGLNKKEQSDFLEFWVPKLSKAPYYFITFIPRSEIDRVSPMSVSPAPDTTIRILMDYKPLTAPITVEPLVITPTPRRGFTVVEWGGIVR